jgi:hypothetical protein
MTVLSDGPVSAPVKTAASTGPVLVQSSGLPGLSARAEEPFNHVAQLAAMAVSAPLASVTLTGASASAGNSQGAPDMAGWQSTATQELCQRVIGSGEKLILGGTRLNPRLGGKHQAGQAGMVAWAGFRCVARTGEWPACSG